MRCLVLCAGYGTRLQRGVQEDASGKYAHLKGVPKPLVPLGGVPLVQRWLDLLEGHGVGKEEVYLVSNAHFYEMFRKWAAQAGVPRENVINDGTMSNDTRLGAVRDMDLVMQRIAPNDAWIVIGGDTLFYDDFDLQELLSAFKDGPSQVLWYTENNVSKAGIIELDTNGLITNFREKPSPEETDSRKGCPCFYMFSCSMVKLLHEYSTNATSLKEVDASGQFIRYAYSRLPIKASPIQGRFDIGSLESYIVAENHFLHK